MDHTAALGGAELALVRLLGELAPEVQVRTILASEGDLVDMLRAHGAQVEVLPLGRPTTVTRDEAGRSPFAMARNTLAVVPFSVRLGIRLRRMRPDLLYTTSLKADLIGVVAAAIAGVPLVWHVHDRIASDYLPERMVRLIRSLARRVPAAVIANSRATAETLPGVHNLTVVPPGFVPAQVRTPTARPTSPAVVGLLGRISPTKGQWEFVRAAALVLREHPDARFRIVGGVAFEEAAYEARVRAEVDRLGIAHAIEFTGWISDPGTQLDEMSLCVHASPTPEPFGQVIVEAMVRGVPVIATRGGGATEIVDPPDGAGAPGEPLGELVDPYDVDGLAAAITRVLNDPAGAEERARRAWTSAIARYPISRTAEGVTQVWRETLQAGDATAGARAGRRRRWLRLGRSA